MTYHIFEMNDSHNTRYNKPWDKGTFRVFHNDDRQCWSISTPFDSYRSNCYYYWSKCGGEFFDGSVWRPLSEYKRELK